MLLLPAVALTACGQSPKAVEEQPLPKAPSIRSGALPPPVGPALAPLATQQQVVRAVDVGRSDPFAAVLTPRLITPPAQAPAAATAPGQRTPPPRLEVPKGLVFQGVLQGPTGREAFVEYAPSESKGSGVRSGTLHVGDVGTGQGDSLLPPGWRVRAIDVARGLLVLQSGEQTVTLEL